LEARLCYVGIEQNGHFLQYHQNCRRNAILTIDNATARISPTPTDNKKEQKCNQEHTHTGPTTAAYPTAKMGEDMRRNRGNSCHQTSHPTTCTKHSNKTTHDNPHNIKKQ